MICLNGTHSYDKAKALMDEFHRRINAGDDWKMVEQWMLTEKDKLDTEEGMGLGIHEWFPGWPDIHIERDG